MEISAALWVEPWMLQLGAVAVEKYIQEISRTEVVS